MKSYLKGYLICISGVLLLTEATLADNPVADMEAMPSTVTVDKAQQPLRVINGRGHNPKSFSYTASPKQKTSVMLRSVVAGLDIDNVQSTAKGGIKLKISLTNQGMSAVVLSNPLDALTIFMWDQNTNQEVRLPFVWRRSDIDDFHPSYHNLLLPYRLESARINKSVLLPQQINSYSVRLLPTDRFEAEVDIDKVEDPKTPQSQPVRPGAFVEPGTQKLVPPPPGRYQIAVSIPIINYQKPAEQIHANTPLIDVTLTP